jgi:catechol 2,3-dioxygenase-like lactoylglutathione lyase family enzyme
VWPTTACSSSQGPGACYSPSEKIDEPIHLPSFLHFAFRSAESPDEVHAFRQRLESDDVEIVEVWNEPGYVSVKCRDPDGYVIEFAWEPR